MYPLWSQSRRTCATVQCIKGNLNSRIMSPQHHTPRHWRRDAFGKACCANLARLPEITPGFPPNTILVRNNNMEALKIFRPLWSARSDTALVTVFGQWFAALLLALVDIPSIVLTIHWRYSRRWMRHILLSILWPIVCILCKAWLRRNAHDNW